ncbi:MAG: HAMP domain-containing histidine kinase [Cyanobacteria bacterium SZAS TMP-1]|nr:HAMP domain-containing histidine kinase [Cyanobacteria bacterium SZAS TMP-1]
MKLTLVHKGLLLVSIPLCFEVVSFAWLLHLQHELQAESARINRSRLIGDMVAKVTSQILLLEDAFEHFQGPGPAMNQVHESMKAMAEDFVILSKLTENDASMHKDVLSCRDEMVAALDDLNQMRRLIASGELENFKQASKAFRARFTEHLRKIGSYGLWQLASRSAREIDTDKSAAIREQAELILKIALSASVVIGLCSAGIYTKYLSLRLQNVSDNATRLGQRKPLLPQISGEDEIGRVDKALHEADQLIDELQQARAEIIGMVSHDIRSPLTTIKCIGDLLTTELADKLDDDSRRQLQNIESNCDRILAISKDLLDIQKLESGTMIIETSKCDVQDCVKAAITATEGLRQSRGVEIKANLVAAPALIDPIRIEQVVTNFLSNSIKYSPRKGVVTIDLTCEDNWVYLSVSDQGKGIPQHLRKDVFARFKQVDADDSRIKGGTGLGLAISKALIEMHEGKIGMESVSPNGSRFYFTLPRNLS